jgi:hypothetical protein
MAKINYVTDDFLIKFKADFQTDYLPLYKNLDKEGILALFNDHVKEGKFDFTYKPLVLPNEVEGSTNLVVANAHILYESFKGLTPSAATQEALWVGMLNTYYIDYLMAEIKEILGRKNEDSLIETLITFTNGNIRSLAIQRLAKYWWFGYKTYDLEHPQDPYWLTDFFGANDASGKSVGVFSSKLTNNKTFMLGIIEAIKEKHEAGLITNNKYPYAYINKYFNFVGGVRILDIMSREQVKDEAMRVLDDVIEGRVELPPQKLKQILG